MDSGNSGSMQSSSGNDEEFDSRNESMSSFLNPSPHNNNFTSFLTQQQQNPTFFDPQQHNTHNINLDHHQNHQTLIPQPSNPNYTNNDLIWSRGLRSEHQQPNNYPNFGNLPPSSSSRTIPNTHQAQGPNSGQFQSPSPSRASQPSDQLSNVIKNPKKRTRASRRAPTTVLTTDTANFRQMVQEFTGIPAAPFSGSPYSRRLDLFSSGSGLRPGPHFDGLYPFRPSAQKMMLSSSSSSSQLLMNSTMADSIAPTTNINATNYQLGSNHNHNHNHMFMNIGNLSGFSSQENAAAAQVGNNSNDGVREENHHVVVGFDGSNINSVGYNLNVSEKGGVENAGSSGAEGNVGSWICPSD